MKKIVLVTGSTSGLGEALAKSISSASFTVYAGARNPDKLKIKTRNLYPIKLDITNDKECELAVKKIIKNEGRIDALINNAGFTIVGPTANFSPQEYLDILDTNAVGAFRLIKLIYPYMKAKRSGKIINIVSLNGVISLPNFGLYSSSKFALEALGLALRYEFAKDGVWVTNIIPGAIAKPKAEDDKKLPHKTVREKFFLLKLIMPMISQEKVVNKILQILENPRPPARVILGADARITHILYKLLPVSIWDRLVRFVWYKK